MAVMRCLVFAVLSLGVCLPASGMAASEVTLTYAPGVNTRVDVTFTSPVELHFPFNAPRLPGGDGTAAVLTIRAGSTDVWRATLFNAPGFYGSAVLTERKLRLSAGRYTFSAIGSAPKALTWTVKSGLKSSRTIRGTHKAPGKMSVLSHKATPAAHAWVEELTLEPSARGKLIVFGGDVGPGTTSTGSLCVSPPVSAVCHEPTGLGSSNTLSGPWIPPLPVLLIEHEHMLFATYSLPSSVRKVWFRGEAGFGSSAWHAAIQVSV